MVFLLRHQSVACQERRGGDVWREDEIRGDGQHVCGSLNMRMLVISKRGMDVCECEGGGVVSGADDDSDEEGGGMGGVGVVGGGHCAHIGRGGAGGGC